MTGRDAVTGRQAPTGRETPTGRGAPTGRETVTGPGDEPQDPPGGPGGVDHRNGPQWAAFVRTVLLALVLLGMIWLVFNVEVPTIDQVREVLGGLGWAAWLGFVVLYALVALTPIPVTVMAVSAGVLFNLLEGAIVSVIGVLIGCWGAYWLARALGRPTVERLLGRHGATVRRHLDRGGFPAVYTLRIMPGVPYWPVNYGAGAFGVSQRDYLVASGVAVIPGQISLVAIGVFAAEPTLARAIVVAVAWTVVFLMTIWALRTWRGTARRPLPGMGLR